MEQLQLLIFYYISTKELHLPPNNKGSMKLEEILLKISEQKCELCKSESDIKLYEGPPQQDSNQDDCIIICDNCKIATGKYYKPATVLYSQNHWK